MGTDDLGNKLIELSRTTYKATDDLGSNTNNLGNKFMELNRTTHEAIDDLGSNTNNLGNKFMELSKVADDLKIDMKNLMSALKAKATKNDMQKLMTDMDDLNGQIATIKSTMQTNMDRHA